MPEANMTTSQWELHTRASYYGALLYLKLKGKQRSIIRPTVNSIPDCSTCAQVGSAGRIGSTLFTGFNVHTTQGANSLISDIVKPYCDQLPLFG